VKGGLQQLWVYLSTTPLLWLTVTLVAFQAGDWLFRRTGNNPLCNPVLLSVAVLVGLLEVSGTQYQAYFGGAQFVHFLLGPATVALAVPLYQQIDAIKRSFTAIAVALVTGSITGIGSAVGIAWLLGGSRSIMLSVAPKSVTTPIAMGISEQIGGLPSLTAIVVILTGIAGAALGAWALDLVKVHDHMARGLAWGVSAHGIGTARAINSNAVAGALAGLGMGLNGLATALLLPALIGMFR
jgi:predicted murein hydrolase (TIGR00659 family)